jgi:hypothetical protein
MYTVEGIAIWHLNVEIVKKKWVSEPHQGKEVKPNYKPLTYK